MGEIIKTTRDTGSSYSGLNIRTNRGSFNACGFGVRDRATETALDTTYFCEVYSPVGGGVSLRHYKFRISTGTATAGPVTFGVWYKDSGSDTYYPVSAIEFDKPASDWQNDTTYYYEDDYSVLLPSVPGRTYYLSIWGEYVKFDATDTGVKRGVTFAGEATAESAIVVGDQTDTNYAVSFEAWGEPTSWERVKDGGAIEELNEDWEDAGGGSYPYCTGTMTDPEKIIGGVTGYAVSGAQNNYIGIDLAAGQIPTTTNLAGDTFPDYSTAGIRAVSKIEVTMTLASGGEVAVLCSDRDSATMPSITGPGWTLLGSEAYVSGSPVTLTIEIPTLCRWIALVELGTSATDQISLCEISQIQTAVTDGDFPVSFLNAYHKCWVANYPTDDKVYQVNAYNAAGAVSASGDPFTNRENKD